MSQLSIDNALNVLGVSLIPANPQALEAAYQSALKAYQSIQGPASTAVLQLLKAAYLSLQNAKGATQKTCASDPGYAARLAQALSWLSTTSLSFEILGAWVWVEGTRGSSLPLESELRAHGFAWASKKARWFLKPQAPSYPKPTQEPWDLEGIRSTYGSQKVA